jgi:hypothetical protein
VAAPFVTAFATVHVASQRSPVVPPNLAGALAWRPARERNDGAALLTLWHDGQWSQVTQAALLRVRYGFIEA